MRELLHRFLRYASVDTKANPDAGVVPSSPGQHELARLLAEELRALGLRADVDEHAYVVATLPARNAHAKAPCIGLLAHLDTACEASGHVRPRVIEQYDGGDIELKPGMTLGPEMFPSLRDQHGKTLIVTDGDSLLGADDKAGIAVIMTVLAALRDDPSLPHPAISVAFVPDEEIGHGAALLDLDAFGADFAYTLDGSGLGTIEFENFNAASAAIDIRGLAIHPGHAKGHMLNAVLLGQEFLNALPEHERPAVTEGREGFYHVTGFTGEVGEARIDMIIRDHDASRFEQRKAYIRECVEHLNRRYPSSEGPRFTLDIREQYRNMLECIEPHRHSVDAAMEAMRSCGIEPRIRAIRGGTDGAQLSWRGLPTPNLFAGDYNGHGPFEYVALEDMEASAKVVLGILHAYAASGDPLLKPVSAFD